MSKCSSSWNQASDERIADHPCYSPRAHHFFARMHLAVAPACNIQCNYCNRKYDCSNESRPGVVSDRLLPDEALQKVYHVAGKVKELSVIGIAGPGDALANPGRTFKTLRLIKEHFPDLKLCLSTNGLALPEYAEQIMESGVEHITVTLNTFDPATAAKIYAWVLVDGAKRNDAEAMRWFLRRQQEGIRALVNLGALVKVNSLLIPGLNDAELPVISKKLKLMGVFMHNIMPLIARPEHGTVFGEMNWPEPTPQQVEAVREACGDIRQMAHCRQCRADAVGKLSEDKFADYPRERLATVAATSDNGSVVRAQWKQQVETFMSRQEETSNPAEAAGGDYLIAACTKGMGLVNQHFGHAKEFYVYRVKKGVAKFINVRRVDFNYCAGEDSCDDKPKTLETIIDTIKDCHAVVCLRVGYGPHKKLETAGIRPVVDVPYMPIEKAVVEAAVRLSGAGVVPGEKDINVKTGSAL